MTRETLQEQNKRLAKELKEARAQIQKLNDTANEAYLKSSYYEVDQACMGYLKNQIETLKSQLSDSQEKNRKADEEIRLLNLEKETAIKNMAYTQDEAHKDLIDRKMLAYELDAARSDCRRLKNANKQLQEDKEVLQQKVKDLEHSVEERHQETTEAYKSMSEMRDENEKEFKKSQRKIWKLEDENKKLRERSENLKNPFGAGRKKNDRAYQKRYEEFADLVRKGNNMMEIMELMEISRSTYFRFLKVFKEK